MNPRSHNRTKILNFIDVSRISSIILLQTVERNKASVQSSPVLQIGTFSPRSPLINPERGEVRHRQFSPAHSVLKGGHVYYQIIKKYHDYHYCHFYFGFFTASILLTPLVIPLCCEVMRDITRYHSPGLHSPHPPLIASSGWPPAMASLPSSSALLSQRNLKSWTKNNYTWLQSLVIFIKTPWSVTSDTQRWLHL